MIFFTDWLWQGLTKEALQGVWCHQIPEGKDSFVGHDVVHGHGA